MARDGYFIAYAIGSDLTQWDNAQAALIAAEINAMDWFISASVTHTKPKTINVNPMTSSHYPKRITSGRERGNIATTHFLQTGILTYLVLGGSTAVAAGVERDITKDTNETPINFGFHVEKEGTTASRRKDMLGMVPSNLNISVSETAPIARQVCTSEFAFTGAGSDLAQPTAFVQSVHSPYNWYNTKNAAGGTSFQYNSGDVNVEILDVNINFGWDASLFGTYDSNFYATNGLYKPPFDCRVTLGCLRKDAGGIDIETITDLDPEDYAGDLDYVIDFYDTSSRYLKFTFDDMYADPESFAETFVSEGDWFDGVQFDLVFRNETSSLAVKTKDPLADTYYTNP